MNVVFLCTLHGTNEPASPFGSDIKAAVHNFVMFALQSLLGEHQLQQVSNLLASDPKNNSGKDV